MYRKLKLNNKVYKNKNITIRRTLCLDEDYDIGDWDAQYPELKMMYNSRANSLYLNSYVMLEHNSIIGYCIMDNLINLDENPYVDKYSKKIVINDLAIYSRSYAEKGKLLLNFIINFATKNYCKVVEVKHVEGFNYFYNFIKKNYNVKEYNGSYYIIINNPQVQPNSVYLKLFDDDCISFEDLYFLFGLKFRIFRYKCVYYFNNEPIITVDRKTGQIYLPQNVINRYDIPILNDSTRNLIHLLCDMYSNNWVEQIYYEKNRSKLLVDGQMNDCAILFYTPDRITRDYELINKIVMTYGYKRILSHTFDFECNTLFYNKISVKMDLIDYLLKSYKFVDLRGLSLKEIKVKLDLLKEFNDKLSDLKRFDFRIGNSFSGIKKFTILFEDEVVIKYNGGSSLDEDIDINKDLIIEELKRMCFSNWKDKYIADKPNEDNCWSVSLVFDDNTITYTGIDKYPNIWLLLIDFIEKYSPLKIRGEETDLN